MGLCCGCSETLTHDLLRGWLWGFPSSASTPLHPETTILDFKVLATLPFAVAKASKAMGRYDAYSKFRWIGDMFKDEEWDDPDTGSVWRVGAKLSERTSQEDLSWADMGIVSEAIAVYNCTDISPNKAPDAIIKIRYVET